MIATGRRDRKITIERATEVRDAIGAVTLTWSTLTYAWAAYIPIPAMESFKAGREAVLRSARFILPYISGLTSEDRISFENDYWNITSWNELGRREGLEVLAEVRK